MLIAPDGRAGVERVGHGDDPGKQGRLAIARVRGIPGQIDLHVMFVGHEHLAIRHVDEAPEPEQLEQAFCGVLLDLCELIIAETTGLVDDVEVDELLSDVVEQGTETELVELLPIETALDDIPALALSETEANRLRCGQAVSMVARANRDRISDLHNGAIVFATSGGKPVALARYEAGDIRPVRVLNL